MEQIKGGAAVAGRQGSSENNSDAKNGAPEAACAPKAAAAAMPVPRHRRSKRSVSTCRPRRLRLLHIWSSQKLRCLTLPPSLFVFQCIFRKECGGVQAWTAVAWRRGAVLRPSTACHRHSLLVQGPLLITELFTARTGGCGFLVLLTGFICGILCQNLPDARKSFAIPPAACSVHQGPRDQRPNASPNHRVSLENDVRT